MVKLEELTLDEMLADPIVHLMMARDGVIEADVRALVARVLAPLSAAIRTDAVSLAKAA